MPKPRRDSGAQADSRPAFSRPPGAAPPPASRPTYPTYDNDDDDDDYESPRRSTPKRNPKTAHKAKNSPAASPADRERRKRKSEKRIVSEAPSVRDRAKYTSGSSADSGSHLLSSDALSKLNAYNEGDKHLEQKKQKQKSKEKQYKNLKASVEETAEQRRRKRKKNRNVSGAILEEGRGGGGRSKRHRSHYHDEKEYEVRKHKGTGDGRKRRKWWILGGIALVVLIVIIAVAIAASKKSSKKSTSGGGGGGSATTTDTGSTPSNACDGHDVPAAVKGNPYTDSSIWADSVDFNCTYTAETIGGLSVMGLNSNWDDSTQANSNVPPLNQAWQYGKMPIRGVNVGGWLSLEPFITPSLFNYPASAHVVDEYTLSAKLGSTGPRMLESHYSTFITKQTFQDIRNAGLDHVRIPYPYWLIQTYDGDPYVKGIGWRYLLRAIEYCRENGLRVNLDLHAVPGSQNGWTHSGRLGSINWIVGTDGPTNAQRSLDIHNQLSTFFAQPRYKNVVTIYGLVNEPKMIVIPHDAVLNWNKQAISLIRANGITAHLAFGDGFLALSDWQGMFQNVDTKLILDTHQYQIFNTGQLKLSHQDKIKLACSGWTGLLVASNNPATGWGPTVNGEWSQADTDCATNINNVGVGSRWAGTLNINDPMQGLNVLTPSCPTSPNCDCAAANADPSQYSPVYKQFLQMYAEAQMHSFEQAWGWFYWTWKTESAVQWSWMLGLNAGILPVKAYNKAFDCSGDVPDFGALGLSEGY